MSSVGTPPRARQSRALFVSSRGESDALVSSLGQRAVHAGNLFDAIGELARAPARMPIAVVLLARSATDSISEQPAKALRRLDPSVRIYLIEGGEESANAVDEEFDAVLQGWPTAEELQRLLAGTGELMTRRRHGSTHDAAVREPAANQHRDNGRPAEQAREEDSPGDSPERGPNQAPEPTPEVVIRSAGRKQDAASQRASTANSQHDARPLGDIDLVEAVMKGSGDIGKLAIKIIEQHTGWADITLAGPSKRSKGTTTALVRSGERSFGTLCAPGASQEELDQWASWLARWLALEEDHGTYRELALQDELTGAWNRRYFMAYLRDAMTAAAKKRLPVTLMVFDIDDFKQYNDRYGHAAGDEILRETVRLLSSVIRKSDRVCRIGGDEFAVIFTDPGGPREQGSAPPESVDRLAQRFQDQICKMKFPKLGIEAPGTLSVSAGLATFPWDGWDTQALLEHADQLAIQSKRRGKNAITLGPGAQKMCGAARRSSQAE